MTGSILHSLGTAVPHHRAAQTDVAEWAKRVVSAECANAPVGQELPRPVRARNEAIDRVYRASAIRERHSVVPDYTTQPSSFSLYPPNWRLEPVPSTATRMEMYRREAPPLAEEAVLRCLVRAGYEPSALSHLIVVSCTGFFAPGLDTVLATSLGLAPHVQRLAIGFMGCHAAFNAMRTADAICRADASAVVLVVCVELCSLHFQREPTMNNIVANSLFSDGAAAILIRSGRDGSAPGSLAFVDSLTRLEPDSNEQMAWTITDTGFQMTLARDVPDTLQRGIVPFVDALLERNRVRRCDVGFWAIHPGGRRIVEVVRDQLRLHADDVAPSFEVLAEQGNMSSPTVLFTLERALARRPPTGTLGVALAFGPGITLESALLRVT